MFHLTGPVQDPPVIKVFPEEAVSILSKRSNLLANSLHEGFYYELWCQGASYEFS
jgi:hypothetical protein